MSFNTIENWPCVLLTCPIRCTIFNTIDSLMFARFSLGEFRSFESENISAKYNAGIGK